MSPLSKALLGQLKCHTIILLNYFFKVPNIYIYIYIYIYIFYFFLFFFYFLLLLFNYYFLWSHVGMAIG